MTGYDAEVDLEYRMIRESPALRARLMAEQYAIEQEPPLYQPEIKQSSPVENLTIPKEITLQSYQQLQGMVRHLQNQLKEHLAYSRKKVDGGVY